MRRHTRLARTAAAFVMAVLAASTLSGCLGGPSGDSVAADRAEQVAEALFEEMTPPWPMERDAEWMVATFVQPAPPKPSDADEFWTSVEALGWGGHQSDQTGAQIEVRVQTYVPVNENNSYFGPIPAHDAGSATRCYHFQIIGVHTENHRMSEYECPSFAAPPLPVATPLPALPEDARSILEQVLLQTTPGNLEADVAAAFPAEYIQIETLTDSGRLIAAVGVPYERDCIVGILEPDGVVEWGVFDRIWLEPGELGCSVRLVTNPPL